jgi:predicted MPP superfamily phosphohydrolase
MPAGIAAAVLLALAFAGHIALGVALFNQMNSAWLPPRWVHRFERAVMLMTGLLPLGIALVLISMPEEARGVGRVLPKLIGAAPWSLVWLYLAPCVLFGALSAGRWTRNRVLFRSPPQLRGRKALHRERVKPAEEPLARGLTGLVTALPGNEAAEILVEEKTFDLARWPAELDQIRIAHLSDLHLNGRIGRAYFQRAVELVNSQKPDMVVLSGDLCERESCLPWLEDFGALHAPLGAFFVLGNHDLRIGASETIRSRLTKLGLIDLGGRWVLHSARGTPLILAGNELPWFAPAAPMERCPNEVDGMRPPRIIVSHSPDQFVWARSFDADLMLAGHTHGGQVRLPWVGPLVAPSRFGVKYASGEFYEAPTLMHVSRGLSSLQPLRFGCPPEITILVLRSGAGNEAAS